MVAGTPLAIMALATVVASDPGTVEEGDVVGGVVEVADGAVEVAAEVPECDELPHAAKTTVTATTAQMPSFRMGSRFWQDEARSEGDPSRARARNDRREG